MTFTEEDERLDLMAAFVQIGLSSGAKVLCLTEAVKPDQLERELTERDVRVSDALRSGQLALRTTHETWMAEGTPTAVGMMDLLETQVKEAVSNGYQGLRVSADMVWATRPLAAIDQLLIFEDSVSSLLRDGKLTVVCHYDRDQFDPVTLDRAMDSHPMALAATAYHDDALLRVCRQYGPPGIRLAGEIDSEHAEALVQALTESIRLDHNIHVNLRGLRFMDMASASIIVRAALSLQPDRMLTVVCDQHLKSVLELAGARETTQLRMQVAHGQP